jgi:outer membrane protein TolC
MAGNLALDGWIAAGRMSSRCALAAALLIAYGCATTRVDRDQETARHAQPTGGGSFGAPGGVRDAEVGRTSADAQEKPADAKGKEENHPTPEEAKVRARDAASAAALQVPVPAPTTIPPPSSEYPIDLATALRLADMENPTIAAARTAILEALAQLTGARALLLPSVNAGSNYHYHNGNLQRSSGRILSVSEQSLYFGGGARTLAAESIGVPMINIIGPMTEVWFEPLAARRRVDQTRLNAQATSNDILLHVSLLHLELLANEAILQADRLTEGQVYQVAIVTNDYAVAGAGRKADADRAQAEWKLHRAAVQRAEEAVAVTAARLSGRLNLDPSVRLRPEGGPMVPINLIALDTETRDLIEYALSRRPDLAARAAGVALANVRHNQELARPWLPTVWLGYSAGAFGGGSNVVPPTLAHFGGRTDFDVRLFWTISNLGLGNLSLQQRRQAQLDEADALRVAMINRVRQEVASARADALAARGEIEIARSELASSENGFREDLERSRQNLGRPIEVLNSLNLLGGARVNLIRALLRYDQAQFRLFVALGSPPPLLTPPQEGQPAPPITTPLRAPIATEGHPLAIGSR